MQSILESCEARDRTPSADLAIPRYSTASIGLVLVHIAKISRVSAKPFFNRIDRDAADTAADQYMAI